MWNALVLIAVILTHSRCSLLRAVHIGNGTTIVHTADVYVESSKSGLVSILDNSSPWRISIVIVGWSVTVKAMEEREAHRHISNQFFFDSVASLSVDSILIAFENLPATTARHSSVNR